MSENTDYDKACREIARIAAALGIVDYSGDTSEIFDAIIIKDEKHQALVAEKSSLYISLFNHGYGSGHHHTVEGYYTDIHRSDITTYHDDIVGELVEDLLRDMPVTTQALNEIKAQGVDELSEWSLKANDGFGIDVTPEEIALFAASLRGNN
ncbi:hypothetical protein [Yersinia enterocolitica]|uniref:hypothetical protein n=1 Tax=Yersinia enterocolitica TaxID=630 RepID=UPI002AC658AA|nr:hypothetical protein [Yersinia enterocolitica]